MGIRRLADRASRSPRRCQRAWRSGAGSAWPALADGRSDQMGKRRRCMGQRQWAAAARVIERQRPVSRRHGNGVCRMHAIAAASTGLAAIRCCVLGVLLCHGIAGQGVHASCVRLGRLVLVARRNALCGRLSSGRGRMPIPTSVCQVHRSRRAHPIQDERQAQKHPQQERRNGHVHTLTRPHVAGVQVR
jgi:hypothetical protein